MAKILVTGGAGFIGSHVVDRLVELKHNVSVIDNLSTGREENVNSSARFFSKDIREDLSELFDKERFDYVFHLAAQVNLRKSFEDMKEDAEINIIGSLNVIANCVKYGVKKIISSSTGGAIYSAKAEIPCSEESEINPESPYGLTKWTIENYLRINKEKTGLDYVCLRYANVFGPRQNAKGEAGVISIFIDNLLSGKELTIFGDGKQTRDFIFVKDVVEANILSFNLSGTFNVSTGKETGVLEIAEKIKKIVGKNTEIVHKKEIKGELLRSCLSWQKIGKLGWAPKYSLDAGLQETADWFTLYNSK